MLIARFLKELQKNVYMIMTFINQSNTLTETIKIITKIKNKIYQTRTNNINSKILKSITSDV